MIQDIAPHKFDNAYQAKRQPKEEDRILCYRKAEIYLKEDEATASRYNFIKFEEAIEWEGMNECPLIYLFAIDDTAFYLADTEGFLGVLKLNGIYSDSVESGTGFLPVQVFRSMDEGDYVPFVIMTGLHISEWMRKNRFCGCCGGPTQPHQEERALVCPNCGNLIFPQISPSVAVAVTDGDRILLARSAQGGFRRFALIAGYVEIGETVEETVHREVMEEVGLKVKNLEYFKSQPWGLSGIEMMGFFVELSGSNQIRIQESELSEAKWFTAEEIDRNMPLHSLSYTLIDEFCRRQEKKKKS